MTDMKSVPIDVQKRMIDVYLSGATMAEAGSLFGFSSGACYHALKRHGISTRSRPSALRRYSVNESYFDKIDSEDKAYWLGFLTADGGVVRNRIVLLLSARDGEHVLKFQAAIASQHQVVPIRRQSRNYVQIDIHSQRLVLALKRLGVGQRKSLVVKPCLRLPMPLVRHYWRGVLDGDGWICAIPHGNWTIGLSGNRFMCEGFRRFLARYISSKANLVPHRNIFTVSFPGTFLPQRVASVLYAQARVFLDRKMELASAILESGL